MTGEEHWFASVPGREVEIVAGGGPDAPDPERVAQAAWAVERLDALLERAKTYLDHFVDRDRLGGGSGSSIPSCWGAAAATAPTRSTWARGSRGTTPNGPFASGSPRWT
jgi:hypothetical protein